jgi:hypothetical protein
LGEIVAAGAEPGRAGQRERPEQYPRPRAAGEEEKGRGRRRKRARGEGPKR